MAITIDDGYLDGKIKAFSQYTTETYREINRLGVNSPVRTIHFAKEKYAPADDLKVDIGLFVDGVQKRLTAANGTLYQLYHALGRVREHFDGIGDLNSASAEEFGRLIPTMPAAPTVGARG